MRACKCVCLIHLIAGKNLEALVLVAKLSGRQLGRLIVRLWHGPAPLLPFLVKYMFRDSVVEVVDEICQGGSETRTDFLEHVQ